MTLINALSNSVIVAFYLLFLAVIGDSFGIARNLDRDFGHYRRDLNVTVLYYHLDVAVIIRRYSEVVLRKTHVVGAYVCTLSYCFIYVFQSYSDILIAYVGRIAGNTLLFAVIHLAVMIALDSDYYLVSYGRDFEVSFERFDFVVGCLCALI